MPVFSVLWIVLDVKVSWKRGNVNVFEKKPFGRIDVTEGGLRNRGS